MGTLVRLLLLVSLLLGLTLLVETLPSNEFLSPDFLDEIFLLAMQESMNKSPDVRSWQVLCVEMLNRNCTNLGDLADVICAYYENLSNTINREARSICDSYSITCTNLSDAREKICQSLGMGSEVCRMLTNVSDQIATLRDACEKARANALEAETMKSQLASYLPTNFLVYGAFGGFVLTVTSIAIGFVTRRWNFLLDLFASLLILALLYLVLHITIEDVITSFAQVEEFKRELPLTSTFLFASMKSHLITRAKLFLALSFLPLACWLGKRFIFS